MRLSKRKSTGGLQLNMTPMIDVVFLLLIFFMTVSQASAVSKKQLELPKQKGSLDQTDAHLVINIDEEGTIFIGGDPCTLTTLVDQTSRTIARHDNDPSRVEVSVRIDRRGKAKFANQVLAALEKLEVSRVRLAVEEVKQ